MCCPALQVLMVVFEILASHYHMARWHEERIDQHTQDMEVLHEAGTNLRTRIDALLKEQAASPSAQRGSAQHLFS
jgi:hypothetical protein